MNKSELIDAMAADAGISKGAAKKALESFVMNVSNSLNEGNRVSLVGFGSFSVSNRAAREGRNPQTGKTISIAAKNVVKFKPGAELDGGVNNAVGNAKDDKGAKDAKDTKAPKAAKK